MPRRYDDRRTFSAIGRLHPGDAGSILGTVASVGLGRTRRGIPYCEAVVEDATGRLSVRWYRQPYLARTLRRGLRVILTGKVNPYPPRQMVNPEHEIEDADETRCHSGRLVPMYPLTAGLAQRFLRRWLFELAQHLAAGMADPLPAEIREGYGLPSLPAAVRGLHIPTNPAEAAAARRRLAFDEFFLFSLAVLQQRALRSARRGIAFTTPGPLTERARDSLPFALTGGQRRVLEIIWSDMAAPRPMQRVLQGDVGSGKTIVAFLAALTAVGDGYQAAIMAPTEILAAQHAERLRTLAHPLGVPVIHVTGGTAAAARREAREVLEGARPCVAVGTHALLVSDVAFGRLGFVVVDEQHRFGVLQRAALQAKGAHPDVLVMSATPIPRSLALVLYGDLDLSVIDELPPGRQPVATVWLQEDERPRMAAELLRCVSGGERGYVVCPVVDESATELKAAVQTAEAYRRGPVGRFGVGLVHGRMSAAEKVATLAEFRAGRTRLLVATTVVEVGVDVPEASLMIIEHADRLGLAQLHQLRGRVGRAGQAAHCFVMADREELTPEAQARLEAFVRERDGFALAEADLRQRGPGEFFGTRQAGGDGFQVGNLAADLRVLEEAREAAAAALRASPDLEGAWLATRRAMESRWASRLSLARVG
jgi:ATP-dependent DNA helicase RecG